METLPLSLEGLKPEDLDLESLESSSTLVNKDNSPPKKSNIRKRTKTGCMTCRRRRIKCDEGKPTCNNCIKSKRQCEGYNTRVVFKDPLGTFPGNPFGPIAYPPDPSDALVNAQLSSAQSKASSSQGPLPIIAPKPPRVDYGSSNRFYHGSVFPQLPRANSTTALELNMNHPHYLMNQWSPDQHVYSPREPFGLVSSPLQLTQQEFQGLTIPIRSPNQNFPELFTPPSRRQSAFARIERPAASSNHDTPGIPPSTAPSSTESKTEIEEKPWCSDDEAPMAASDDELPTDGSCLMFDAGSLGSLVAKRLNAPLDPYGIQMRSFHTLANANVLVNYEPSSTTSPLNNHQTAMIFWYFVNTTAAALNMYERNSPDPSRVFSVDPAPKSIQHIWTHVFPCLSFQHPALLQAILALGSQQMAQMSGEPTTASLKHYHLSIRRSVKNYESTSRRAQPATLAATLLMGFYEVWRSDHDKWCTHMCGARAIIKEIPLREMTRSVIERKRQKRRQQQFEDMHVQPPLGSFVSSVTSTKCELIDVDLGLVSLLHGSSVSFDEEPYNSSQGSGQRRCTERDIENYENITDLYWWFCKMDVYQSILSGSSLLLEYDLWSQCPPRAPFGRIEAVYGTFDHLVVLLGRVANFATSDMARKRRAREMELNSSLGVGHSSPMFAGLVPGRRHVRLPRGFSPPRETSPSSEVNEDDIEDLEESTNAAIREWESILQAFNIFQAKLGPDFDPMGPEYQPTQYSPFGTALMYRKFDIAGIWMNFYMGLVLLHRAHPNLPPYAMVAAHQVADQTAPFANQIGRIVSGIAEDCSNVTSVSTLVGAVFIESCFPLFVAAVQLTDKVQRVWVTRRLHDITRLTGWQTGDQIASGCEGAWKKAASMGYGPPFEPEPAYDPQGRHVWTARRIDDRIQEIHDGQDKIVLKKEQRAHLAFGLLSVEQDMERLTLTE